LITGHPAHIPAKIFRSPNGNESTRAGAADLRHDRWRARAVGEALARARGDDEQRAGILHTADEGKSRGIITRGGVRADNVGRHLRTRSGKKCKSVRRRLLVKIIRGRDAVGGRNILHEDVGTVWQIFADKTRDRTRSDVRDPPGTEPTIIRTDLPRKETPCAAADTTPMSAHARMATTNADKRAAQAHCIPNRIPDMAHPYQRKSIQDISSFAFEAKSRLDGWGRGSRLSVPTGHRLAQRKSLRRQPPSGQRRDRRKSISWNEP